MSDANGYDAQNESIDGSMFMGMLMGAKSQPSQEPLKQMTPVHEGDASANARGVEVHQETLTSAIN